MRRLTAAALVAIAGALTAPAGQAAADENAQDTINDLQSRGYYVTVNRFGNAPLKECTVTSVREAPLPQQILPFDPDDDLSVFQLPQRRTAVLTVDCTH